MNKVYTLNGEVKLELKITGHYPDPEDTYNTIYKIQSKEVFYKNGEVMREDIKDFELLAINNRELMFYVDYYMDNEEIDIEETINSFDTFFNNLEEFEIYLQKLIINYAIDNKIPYNYMSSIFGIDEFEDLVERIYTKNFGTCDKSKTFQYIDGGMLISNKYLSKKYKTSLTGIDCDKMKQMVLDFNNEWNSIIDGKFDVSVYGDKREVEELKASFKILGSNIRIFEDKYYDDKYRTTDVSVYKTIGDSISTMNLISYCDEFRNENGDYVDLYTDNLLRYYIEYDDELIEEIEKYLSKYLLYKVTYILDDCEEFYGVYEFFNQAMEVEDELKETFKNDGGFKGVEITIEEKIKDGDL